MLSGIRSGIASVSGLSSLKAAKNSFVQNQWRQSMVNAGTGLAKLAMTALALYGTKTLASKAYRGCLIDTGKGCLVQMETEGYNMVELRMEQAPKGLFGFKRWEQTTREYICETKSLCNANIEIECFLKEREYPGLFLQCQYQDVQTNPNAPIKGDVFFPAYISAYRTFAVDQLKDVGSVIGTVSETCRIHAEQSRTDGENYLGMCKAADDTRIRSQAYYRHQAKEAKLNESALPPSLGS